MNAVYIHRVGHWLHAHSIPLLPRLCYWLTFLLYNSSIPPEATIGAGTRFAYGGIGVVIHKRARVGARVTIAQQVTIGGRSGKWDVPVIGDDVVIGAGAKILGPVTIGRGAVIGANAVVISDIPDGCTAVGVPARILVASSPADGATAR